MGNWSKIRAEYQRHRHAAFPDPGGLHARNAEQQWLAHFDSRGFTVTPDNANWRWGLELAGITGKASISANVNRITYRWDAGFEEWYVNDSQGLEHGFTLFKPRQEIVLNVRGGLIPRLSADGISFVDHNNQPRLLYSQLSAWDADGKKLPARMSLRNGQLVLNIDDAGAQYPVTIDPVAQQAYIKASNSEANDSFGWSVAVSGETVVVGAPGEDSNATGVNGDQSNNAAPQRGAAYVFVRNGTTWTQQAYLKPTPISALFGSSVAIHGDTIVVGSADPYGISVSSPNVFVFVRSGATWSDEAIITRPAGTSGDHFGIVTVSGDTIAISDYSENTVVPPFGSIVQVGAVYIYTRRSGAWSMQTKLRASNARASDYFGISLAVSGDTLVAGGIGDSSNATGVNGDQTNTSKSFAGAAYVFVRNGSVWTQQAYLKASNTDANDQFGFSVAASGDSIAVGARYEASNATSINGNQADNSLASSGAAYVFVRNGSTWTQQAYLKASNSVFNAWFGDRIAMSGDSIVVGARVNEAAYLFTRNGAAWTQTAFLRSSNDDPFDGFGFSVGVSGDIVIASSYSEDSTATGINGNQLNNGALQSGAAYAFDTAGGHFTIASSPSGLSFSISGAGCSPGSGYTTPQLVALTAGSACVVTFANGVANGNGTQYTFNRWEDNSTNPSRTVFPAPGATYTATLDAISYLLTTVAGPGGSVTNGGTYLSGSNVQVTATALAGFAFSNFTGAVTSTNNPLTVPMDGPKSITANFVAAPYVTAIITSKTGPANARVWTLQVTNSGTVAVPSPYLSSRTLTQTFGALCTPVFTGPSSAPTINVGASANMSVNINFSTCAAGARFTFAGSFATFPSSLNVGSISVTNQFR